MQNIIIYGEFLDAYTYNISESFCLQNYQVSIQGPDQKIVTNKTLFKIS